MKTSDFFFATASLFFAFGFTSHSQASLVFTSDVQANFTFTAVPGNVLGLPDNEVLPFVAFGQLTFTLDDSVPLATTMAFTNATGVLTVNAPAMFAGATMSPHEFVLGGELQSITRDGFGTITGGVVSNLQMRWEMLVPTGMGSLRLYTVAGLPFDGVVTGAPFQVGDSISGLAPFDVFLDVGPAGPDAGDPLVVIGSDRFLTITAVPEPSSLALLALGGLSAFRFKRFRLRSRRSN